MTDPHVEHPSLSLVLSQRDALAGLARSRGVGRIRVLVDPTATGDPTGDPGGDLPVELVVDFDLDGHEGLDLFAFADAAGDLLGRPVRVGTGPSARAAHMVEVPLGEATEGAPR